MTEHELISVQSLPAPPPPNDDNNTNCTAVTDCSDNGDFKSSGSEDYGRGKRNNVRHM